MITVPIGFALVSLGLLVAGTFTEITWPAVVLACGALIAVLGRLALTFRAHQATLEHSQSEALTDPLTGLGNRRALAVALERRLDRSRPETMILALFDLDGFKSYNDSFGHAAGDALLQRLAMALGTVLDGAGQRLPDGRRRVLRAAPGRRSGPGAAARGQRRAHRPGRRLLDLGLPGQCPPARGDRRRRGGAAAGRPADVRAQARNPPRRRRP